MAKEEMVKEYSDMLIEAGIVSRIVGIYFTVLYKKDREVYNNIKRSLETGELEIDGVAELIKSKEFEEVIKPIIEEMS